METTTQQQPNTTAVGVPFAQLSDRAKQKALDDHYDINVHHNWWRWTYEDAEAIGLKLEGHDEYKAEGSLIDSAEDVIKAILENGGYCFPIYMYEDKITEGQHRLVAFYELGLEQIPIFEIGVQK